MTEFEKAMIEQMYKLNRIIFNILTELSTIRHISNDVHISTQCEYLKDIKEDYDWIDQKDYYKDEYEIDVCNGKYDTELMERQNETGA